jgi:hypothetical protein
VLNLEHAINQLNQRHRPEFVVLFSSLASILGGYGMAGYTAANRFMDAFVQARSERDGTAWVCVNWDDWHFEYTKEQTAAYDKTSAQYAIPPSEGLKALERILSYRETTQVLVATRPMAKRVAQWLFQKDKTALDPTGIYLSVDETSDADPSSETGGLDEPEATEGETELERQVGAVYKQVLGIEQVRSDDNFFDLGGDSLLAAQILLRLQRAVPEAETAMLKSIFDYPTVRQLSEHLMTIRA